MSARRVACAPLMIARMSTAEARIEAGAIDDVPWSGNDEREVARMLEDPARQHRRHGLSLPQRLAVDHGVRQRRLRACHRLSALRAAVQQCRLVRIDHAARGSRARSRIDRRRARAAHALRRGLPHPPPQRNAALGAGARHRSLRCAAATCSRWKASSRTSPSASSRSRGLREAERRYHSLFENAIEGIFRTSPEGQYLDANPASPASMATTPRRR